MLKTICLIGFILTSFYANAGQIQHIQFADKRLNIQHTDCQPQPIIQEQVKLIIPLKNCQSYADEIHLTDSIVKKIHWAQHDKTTVWVVVTLVPNYQFEQQSSFNQLNICFPQCQQTLLWHTQSTVPQVILFELGDIHFTMPLQNMKMNEFIDKSIGFVPKDVIRDGLPHFNSQRDDWLGKPRKHKGYDIYTNHINVLAMADGKVDEAEAGKLSGLYIKLKHEKEIYTVYVHLTHIAVQKGEQVKQGQMIGRIDGAAGNAVQPQLHIEIKPNNESIDPLPLIELYYQDDLLISKKIQDAKSKLPALIRYREQQLQQFLQHRQE